MKTVQAIYNAGRWLVYCPIHGNGGAVLAEPQADPTQSKFWTENNEYICPVCHHGIAAQMTVQEGKRIVTVNDNSARRTARMMAEKADEIYQVVFPDEKKEIEAVLSIRPPLMRNWDGIGETIEFLSEENKIVDVIMQRQNGI